MLIATLLSGCAVSRSRFIKERYSLSNVDTCRVYLRDHEKLKSSYSPSDSEEQEYLDHIKLQMERRNLNYHSCDLLVQDDNVENMMIGAAVLGVIAIGVAAANSGGGGYTNYQQQGYAWDAFYGSSYNLMWRCRNKSNGQFADDRYCSNKLKVDDTWPQK